MDHDAQSQGCRTSQGNASKAQAEAEVMPHCEKCHQDYGEDLAPAEAIEPESVEEITSAEVEIARINAKRDVDLAKINAGVAEHVAEVDQAAELAHAEGEAEGLREALEPEQPSETPPVVVMDDPSPEPETEAPAPPEESSEPSSEHHEPKHTGYGNSAWFS